MKTIDMKRRSNIDVFFVLCVFLICALLLLGMLFVGADTQQKINRSTEDNFYMRTGLLYISNKAKYFNEQGKVSVASFDGKNVLVFEEMIDGVSYTTKVYSDKGYLMELFTEKGYELGLEAGTIITEIDDFKLKVLADGLIEVAVESPNGETGLVIISNC